MIKNLLAGILLSFILICSLYTKAEAACSYPTSTISALTACGAPVIFQVKMTGSSVQFPTNTLVNGLFCTAKGSNAAAIEIGPSGVTTTVDGTGNGYSVAAGSGWSGATSNSNLVYAIGTNNDVLFCSGN